MSRDQETDVNNTAKAQNATQFADSQSAEKQAEGTIGTQLATNPYTQGGAFQSDTNKIAANTADVGAATTASQLQTQAQRTGQNQTAANATALAGAQANERALSAEEAKADQERIAAGAGYTGAVEGEEAGLAGQQGSEAGGTLSTQQKAAEDPSFLDTFGNAAAGALGNAVVKGVTPCWVAAELYGGWDEPRTVLVREWLFKEFIEHWYGYVPCLLYYEFGERVAARIRKAPVLRWVCRKVFDVALWRARKWKGGK